MHSNFQSFNPAAVGHKHMTCSITPGTLCTVLYTYLQLFTFFCANFRQFLWCCRDIRQGISTVNGHSDKLSKLMLSKLLHHKCFCTQWENVAVSWLFLYQTLCTTDTSWHDVTTWMHSNKIPIPVCWCEWGFLPWPQLGLLGLIEVFDKQALISLLSHEVTEEFFCQRGTIWSRHRQEIKPL